MAMPDGGYFRKRYALFAEQGLLFPIFFTQARPESLAQGMGRGPGDGEEYEPMFMGDDHRTPAVNHPVCACRIADELTLSPAHKDVSCVFQINPNSFR